MAEQISKKEIYRIASDVISMPSLSFMLTYRDHDYYNSTGYLGWNFDCFLIEDVAVCQGYRNVPGIKPDYEIFKKYNLKAKEISNNTSISHQERAVEVDAVLREFIEKVLGREI